MSCAIRVRMSRNADRARLRKRFTSSASGGSAVKATRLSCQSRISMATTMPTSVIRSVIAVTAPEAKSSASESMSLVTRVTTRPTGVRSK